MGQFDKAIRLQVLDTDKGLRAELETLSTVGMEVVHPDASALASGTAFMTDRDVVVVNVESRAGLALVLQICSQEDAPPVIAIGGKGFDRKSLEHVLILAEVRGAMATLPKPFDAAELAMAATQVRRRMSTQPAEGAEARDRHERPRS